MSAKLFRAVFALMSLCALILCWMMLTRRVLNQPYRHETTMMITYGLGPAERANVENFDICYDPPIPDYLAGSILFLIPAFFILWLVLRRRRTLTGFPITLKDE